MINERVFRNLCDTVDVDEAFLEILINYVDRLVAIGIDLNYVPLQEAIEGNISNLESACQSFIGYAGWLAHHRQRFDSEFHATLCFTKALIEHWKPYPDWDQFADIAVQSRYRSPYEQALHLVHQINQADPHRNWDTKVLDALSDELIEELIPHLQTELDAFSRMATPVHEGNLPLVLYRSRRVPLWHLFTMQSTW